MLLLLYYRSVLVKIRRSSYATCRTRVWTTVASSRRCRAIAPGRATGRDAAIAGRSTSRILLAYIRGRRLPPSLW